ncbi:ATP-binding protein, partial [Microbispora sp. NPDC049633]|uniref:sensor histidine kinase n=1 Tax=Microbispora sp. NPDC049633 TaxID=3154355 RepID=UPI003443217E
RALPDAPGHPTPVSSLQAAVPPEALPGDPSAAASAVEAIRQASGEAMRELRVTLGLLRRPTGEAGGRAPVGGLAELDRLVARVRAGGLTATLRILGTAVPVPHVIDVTAYRIVQESLTNVLRHAAATTVEVVVRYGRELEITVSDDGRGGAPGGGGEGLRGMAERAELLDGSLWAGEGEDGGFQVRAVLPLAVPGRAAPPGTARLPAPAAQ